MTRHRTLGIIIIALSFLVAAGAHGKTKNSRNVLVPYDGSLAGSHLASGRYQIQWVAHGSEATVNFYRDGGVVLTTKGQVVDRSITYPNNEVVYQEKAGGSRVIREIRFAGLSQVLVFHE